MLPCYVGVHPRNVCARAPNAAGEATVTSQRPRIRLKIGERLREKDLPGRDQSRASPTVGSALLRAYRLFVDYLHGNPLWHGMSPPIHTH